MAWARTLRPFSAALPVALTGSGWKVEQSNADMGYWHHRQTLNLLYHDAGPF